MIHDPVELGAVQYYRFIFHVIEAQDPDECPEVIFRRPAEAYLADAKAFQLLFAEHYFRTTYETIKRYDPNHLVMGCRFGAPPDSALLQQVAPWMDVLSQNN